MSRYGRFPDQASFDAEVKRLYNRGRDDTTIAYSTDSGRRSVLRSRQRQELPALFGPGGRPVKRLAAA